jgi:hypothetical protein
MFTNQRLTELALQSRNLARGSSCRETKRMLKGMAEDFELMARGAHQPASGHMPKYRGIFP